MSLTTAIAAPAAGSLIGAWANDPTGGLHLSGAEPRLTGEERDVQERVNDLIDPGPAGADPSGLG